MNKLNSMMTFVRVAESGSFTAAAGQLGVSVSAVAKAVARLEEELDTQLLVRSTRKVALSEEGRAFYVRCRGIPAAERPAQTRSSSRWQTSHAMT